MGFGGGWWGLVKDLLSRLRVNHLRGTRRFCGSTCCTLAPLGYVCVCMCGGGSPETRPSTPPPLTQTHTHIHTDIYISVIMLGMGHLDKQKAHPFCRTFSSSFCADSPKFTFAAGSLKGTHHTPPTQTHTHAYTLTEIHALTQVCLNSFLDWTLQGLCCRMMRSLTWQ